MEPIGYSKEKAKNAMEKFDIDILIASTPVNLFYTTGIPTLHVAPNPILYVLSNQYPTLSLTNRNGDQSLVVWMLYQSIKKFTWIQDVDGIASPKASVNMTAKKIESWGLSDKTIGIESLMPRYQSEALRERFPNAKFVNADDAFLEMRLIKTEEEINRIKKSTEISEKAIQTMIESVREGISDNELLQIARRTIVDEGADGWDHLTLGIGSSDPEAPGIGTKVKRGDICRFDIGSIWEGYVSDLSRHVVIGNTPDDVKTLMDNMIQVQDFCVDNIKPGVVAKKPATDANKFYKNLVKRGSCFITGHSIGLECEEFHYFSPMKKMDIPFRENMVLDIEVWQMYKDLGLIGVEDCYRITQNGCERLSSLDKSIFEK